MLHYIRERAQGWVAWFIVGLISIPFALWGVNSYLTGASDVAVATVNGEQIMQTEYQRALQQYRDRMRASLGEQFDPSLLDNAETKHQILEGLIQQRLLYSANMALGQEVSNGAVSQSIQQTSAFQVDGQFDMERYKMLLSRAGFSPASYEAQLRMDLLSQELTNAIQRTATVTQADVEQLLRLEKQQRNAGYGVIEAAPLAAGITVSDADARMFYEQNQALYTRPEQVTIDYVELSLSDLMQQVEVDEAMLTAFYSDNENQFMTQEERRASHILIEGDAEQALKILAAAEHRLQQGEAFEVVARELSQDAGSASEGGDLGYFQPGVMDSAFDQAVFGLEKIGDVSAIVQSEFGHHLIKLTGIKAPEGKAFEDVRAEVESSYRRQQAEQQFFEQAELLAELTYENPDNLDLAVEELNLAIQSVGPFNREGGAGIATNPKVINAAFSEDVLKEELNSAVLELSTSQLVVLRKQSHQLTSQLDYDVVADQIKRQLQSEQASQQARQQGEAALAELESGAEAVTLFEAGQWFDDAIIARNQPTIDPAISDAIYAMPKPADSPVYHGFALANGDYVVARLNTVEEGDISVVSEQDRTGLAAYLARSYGDSELKAFLASLKAEAEIELSPNL